MRADIIPVIFDSRTSRLARDVALSLDSIGAPPEEIHFGANCPAPIVDYRRGMHLIADPKLDFDKAVRHLGVTLKALAQGGKHQIMLFPSDDLHLNLMVAAEVELTPWLCSPLAGRASLRNLLDKAAFFRSIQELDVPKPKTVSIESAHQIADAASRVGYPCVLKPARKDPSSSFFQFFGKKSITLDSAADLCKLSSDLSRLPPTNFVLQQKIPGSVGSEYSCGGIRFPDGRLHTFCARRVRQDQGGTGTYAVTVDEPDLKRIAQMVVEHVDYAGIFELDCIRSDQDHRFYVMEFNPRVWLQYRIGEVIGINLPALALAWFSGKSADVAGHESICAEWIDLEEDFFVAVLRGGKAQAYFKAWRWCIERRRPRVVQGCRRASLIAPWKVALRHLLLRPGKYRVDKLFKSIIGHTPIDAQSVASTLRLL